MEVKRSSFDSQDKTEKKKEKQIDRQKRKNKR
jgi:hypothetical protein